MMKKMAKSAGVPDMVIKWIESGFSRKSEPPKELEPTVTFKNRNKCYSQRE